MDFAKSLIVFSLTNFVVLVLISLAPGGYLVFGNANSGPQWSLIKTSILIALMVTVFAKVIHLYNMKLHALTFFSVYLCVNVLVLYTLARTEISEIIGVGVSGFWVAVIVGVFLNVVQYKAWKTFLAKKGRKG